MSMQTAMLATLIVILGAAQYGLDAQALRDLARRPRVRGDNKALWALCILCIPLFGAVIYNWMGPTSFVGRPRFDEAGTGHTIGRPVSNVTSIATARAARRRGAPTGSQANRPPPPTKHSGPPRGSRTGS